MLKINKGHIAVIASVLLLVIIITTYHINANNIKAIEQTIETNEKQIYEINYAQEQLHSLAEYFRNSSICDDNFIKKLQDEWSVLDIKKKELQCDNINHWNQIEYISSKRIFLGTFEITAYCQGNITSTGTKPTAGRTIAVDPNVIPYGSVIEIEGYGTYVAEDCGGAVKGNIIDMYIPNYDKCIQFGRKKLNVYIIKE